MSDIDKIRDADRERARLDFLLKTQPKSFPSSDAGHWMVSHRKALAELTEARHEIATLRVSVDKLWAVARFAKHLPKCSLEKIGYCNCGYKKAWDALPED